MQADLYPIAFLWSEARLVRRRKNHELANWIVHQHSMIAAAVGGDKKFSKTLEKLQNAD